MNSCCKCWKGGIVTRGNAKAKVGRQDGTVIDRTSGLGMLCTVSTRDLSRGIIIDLDSERCSLRLDVTPRETKTLSLNERVLPEECSSTYFLTSLSRTFITMLTLRCIVRVTNLILSMVSDIFTRNEEACPT